MHRAYEDADIFIDTFSGIRWESNSSRDGSAALDHQGAADLVTDDAGIKVPVSSIGDAPRGCGGHHEASYLR